MIFYFYNDLSLILLILVKSYRFWYGRLLIIIFISFILLISRWWIDCNRLILVDFIILIDRIYIFWGVCYRLGSRLVILWCRCSLGMMGRLFCRSLLYGVLRDRRDLFLRFLRFFICLDRLMGDVNCRHPYTII